MAPHQTGDLLLNRYVVTDVLGKGAFGTTWAATDEQTGSSVAIKALDLSRVDDWKAVELFEREAHTLEQLDHPYIPDYLDFVPVQADETGYLVQSLAPGEPLDRVLERKGRFSDAEIEGIAVRVLEIIAYLEGLNPPVVHRDIKPSNLILDGSANVYLVDFGAVQDAAKRTTEGGSTVAGTFGYMAPEQLHGSASPRSDLYALGMTLIHLASGTHPSDLPRKGLHVDFHGHVDLPPELLSFIDTLVAPSPDDRWPGAAEALRHLRREVPTSPNLTPLPAGGSDVANTVLARERAAEQARQLAERQRVEAIEKRRIAVAKRRDRVKVAMNATELNIEYRPRRWPTGLATGGIAAFLFANPGFVIAGGFPFFGPLWPVFSDNWLGRWTVWAGVVFFIWALVVWFMTPPRNIRLSNKGFFTAFKRRENNPTEAGRFDRFAVTIYGEEPGFPGESAEITLRDESGATVFQERFENLSKADVELLDTLPDDWLQPHSVVLGLEESNDETESEAADVHAEVPATTLK